MSFLKIQLCNAQPSVAIPQGRARQSALAHDGKKEGSCHGVARWLLTWHRPLPHNPNIANAFFRSGQIETWGRGIEKIETACKAEGRPAPVFAATGTEIIVTFSTAITDTDDSVNAIENVSDQALSTTQRAILQLISVNPFVTTAAISEKVGVTQRRVASNMAKLKALGLIEREGSDRQGSWLVR